jgi:hypothetical protein
MHPAARQHSDKSGGPPDFFSSFGWSGFGSDVFRLSDLKPDTLCATLAIRHTEEIFP